MCVASSLRPIVFPGERKRLTREPPEHFLKASERDVRVEHAVSEG
jgi:hypothetical protein